RVPVLAFPQARRGADRIPGDAERSHYVPRGVVMELLYVLYDSRCGLCTWLKGWLLRQRTWIRLRMVDSQSQECVRLFPTLSKQTDDLVVVSCRGEVWRNDRAWIMVMFALRGYREWARRMAHPVLLPFARNAFTAISKNRVALSYYLGLDSEADI